eukprot:219473_1
MSYNRLYFAIKRNLSTSIKSYEKCKYLGPSNKPSITLQNHHLDTSIWNDIDIADTDIFLVSSAKSGSTWMYEIIARLLYHNIDHGHKSLIELCLSPTFNSFRPGGPTKDATIESLETINNQLKNNIIKHRLFKLHEPVESLPFKKECKYIFVARDFRDIIWSFYRHYSNYSDSIMKEINSERYNYNLINKLAYFDDLNKNNDFTEYKFWQMSIEMEDDFGNPDGYPFWSQLWVIGSWLNICFDSKYNNVKMIHYNEMQNDLPKVIKEIADFLSIEIDENAITDLSQYCLFDNMKSQQAKLFGEIGKFWYKQPEEFFYKGVNNRWENILTKNDIDNYRKLAKRYLNSQQLDWLEQRVMVP